MRPHRVVASLVPALALAMAAAVSGCVPDTGDSGVATAQSPGQPTAGASTTPDPQRFAACLRDRGLDVADPPPGEQVEIPEKDDAARAALRACARYAPPSHGHDRGTDPAAARAYASCVRDKGFPDFPDPDANGPRIPKELIGDERFEAADRECSRLINDGKGSKP